MLGGRRDKAGTQQTGPGGSLEELNLGLEPQEMVPLTLVTGPAWAWYSLNSFAEGAGTSWHGWFPPRCPQTSCASGSGRQTMAVGDVKC